MMWIAVRKVKKCLVFWGFFRFKCVWQEGRKRERREKSDQKTGIAQDRSKERGRKNMYT